MTINKSQGQTFQKSRVRSFDGLRFYISEHNGQGQLANDERVFTKSIVYREVLNL
jgi:hypothetical protein